MFETSSNETNARRARCDDVVVARSTATQSVDGYEYFPPEDVNWDVLEETGATSVCYWKGQARYYDVVVGPKRLARAAWTYPEPSPAAEHIRGHVAFWRGVQVEAGE